MVSLLFGQAERGEYANHVLSSHASEDVTLVEKFLTYGRDWLIELYANHEATATHILDTAALGHIVEEVFADGCGVLLKMLITVDVSHGDSSRHAKVVATECRAEHTLDGFELGRYEDSSHWEAIGYALSHGYDVGLDACGLMCEESASATIAALYLVEDKNRAMGMAEGLKVMEELVVGDIDATATLDALNYDSGNVVLLNILGH